MYFAAKLVLCFSLALSTEFRYLLYLIIRRMGVITRAYDQLTINKLPADVTQGALDVHMTPKSGATLEIIAVCECVRFAFQTRNLSRLHAGVRGVVDKLTLDCNVLVRDAASRADRLTAWRQ